jgi:mono/diheme cytochrome c family protein
MPFAPPCRHAHLALWSAGIAASLFTVSLLAATTQPAVSFRRDVAPVLLNQCQECHGPKKAKGGYRLDTFERLTQSGDSDHAPVVAGKPGDSELFNLITTGDEDNRMPKKAAALPDAQIATIKRWIEQGAAFDGPNPSAPLTSLVAAAEHPAPPEVYREPVPIGAIAFSPDGGELAVSGYHEVTIWDPSNGKLLGRIQKLPERTYGLAYSADGKLLAAACGTPGVAGEARLCDPVTRRPGQVLDRITDAMLVVRFSPDGAHLAAGGADNAIRVYDLPAKKRQWLIEQHGDWVTDLAFSPDSTRLASASRDRSARLFDVKTGQMLAAFLGHNEAVFGVAWDPDGQVIFNSGHDRKVLLWNPAAPKKPGEITGFEADPFKLEVGMGSLFCACADGIVRQYSLGDRQMERAYPRAADWIYCLALDPKHRRVATGSHGGEVCVWGVDDGKLVTRFIAAPGYAGRKP